MIAFKSKFIIIRQNLVYVFLRALPSKCFLNSCVYIHVFKEV